MGGNAFPHLHVPRLPHDIYYLIRDQCQTALKDFFEDVVSPAEAPDKSDHGDVDFLVARPKVDAPESIAKAIGATDQKHTSNSKTTHFALELPGREGEFAQVDVHVCPPDYFHWELFLQSYGDLEQILGLLNRPIGLTANDKGLHFRIEEIEPRNRKKAMIFLTKDPDDMMRFLGLDVDAYHAGFSTDEAIFNWCFDGRLYRAPRLHEETSNDRNRLRKRDMFIKCMREWYPERKDELFPDSRRVWTKAEIITEALEYFPQARVQYDATMEEFKQTIWEEGILTAMEEVRPNAEDKEKTEVVRGSKRFVQWIGGEWMVSDKVLKEDVALIPDWMKYIRTEDDKSQFLEWLDKHWSELHQKERARMQEKEDLKEAKKFTNRVKSLAVDDDRSDAGTEWTEG